MSKALVNLSKDIKEICDPYFKQLGLDHLNYIHRDDHGNVTYLCSNQKWLNHYIKKSYPKIGAFEKNTELSQYNYILWTGLDRNDPILIDSKEMLDVEYGITLIKREEEGFGFYNLGTKSSDSSIINRYVNNLDEYENFIQYFQDKTKNLFRSAKNLKFHINSGSTADGSKKTGHQFGRLYLTDREYECVNYLIRGKTAEEIAIILNISKRTVETHVQHIKRKMNCYNQFRLGYLLGCLDINIT